MKFSPCLGGANCTYEGTHCNGCGRSHEEIAETKKLIMALVSYAQQQQYENYAEFANFVSNKVIKKIEQLS
jgi:predicted Fe-S protein YdhL (DUF1289 family)